MRTTIVATALFSLLLIAPAESQTPGKNQDQPRTRVAVVNLMRLTNSGINYDKIRMLSLDKPTREAMKKVNKEIQELQAQIVDVNDETTLQEMSRRMNFLNQKNMLLRQRVMNGGEYNRDIQGQLRKFIIEKYKSKYSLILQQHDQGNVDRVIFKAPTTEYDDITDDVREDFQKYLDQAAD